MADDDEAAGEASFDPTFATAGPRRSTFTPPPASAQRPPGDDVHDDDALADALAQEYTRLGSGTISLPPQTIVPLPAPAVEVTPAPEPPPPPVAAPPPWVSAPAPDPAQAVPLEGPFDRPVRRSLPDDELLRQVGEAGRTPGGTLDIIEQLQSQLNLREKEAREFQAWESRMHSLGTPEAEAAVDEARPEFTGVLPGVPLPPAEPPRPILPSWEVPAPSENWSPAPEEEHEPEPTAPPTPPTLAPTPFDELFQPAPEAARPVYQIDEPDDAAPFPQSVWAAPPEGVVEATLEPFPEPESEPAPQHTDPAVQTADVVEPEPTAPVSDFRFAPPPLVEPPPFGAQTVTREPERNLFDDLLIEPPPVVASEFRTDTGSVTIIDQAYENDLEDDVVDETDRVFTGLTGPVAVDAVGNAVIPEPIHPPSGPISTVRIPEDELVLIDNEPTAQPVFSIEQRGPDPTPVDQRVGRAARLFWLWFAANSSILSLGLGAAVFAVGMSLRQSIVAILAGIALSFIPLGLTTLAGKRSGQPTMIVSRATFGLLGNVVPAVLAFVTRVFWGAVLLWLLGSAVAIVLVGADLSGALGERVLQLVSLGLAFVIAVLIAFAGYPLLARMQLVLSVISGVLVVGLIVLTAGYINLEAALSTPDGPWLLTVGGAVLVFSFVGLVWANSGADLARYQRADSSGASSMLWATFGATLPAFLLIGYGALLAASNRGIATGFLQSPLDTLALMLPTWYPVPLLAASALSLLSGITISLYSSGFALQAIGVRMPRRLSVLVGAAVLGVLALVFTLAVPGGIFELFTDAATTLAVPTAAWAGIFAAETMIRNRRFESESLVRRGGVYTDVRWVNLIALLMITAIGFAFTTATITWLSWQGYGFAALGLPLDGDVARTDLGVLVALVLGLLTPIVAGIPAIRRQEATRL